MTAVAPPIPEGVVMVSAPAALGEEVRPPTAGDFLSMLRRRVVLVASLFFVLAGLVTGGFALWWVYIPGYSSDALVECITNVPDAELTLDQERLQQDEHDRFVMTQAVLLKSPSILGDALKVTAVRETEWYRSVQANQHLLELIEELAAAPVRGTNFLRVQMECRNLKDPAVIVNEVVNQWFHAVKKRSAEEFADDAIEAALEERSSLVREIEEGREQLRGIARRLPAGARPEGTQSLIHEQLREYAQQVALLELELSQVEQFRAMYNSPEGVAVTAEDRAIVELDPQVAEMMRTLVILQQQRAADEQIFGTGHRVVQQLDAQIQATETQLAELRTERLNERRHDIREAANSAYGNTQYALLQAKENLARAEAGLQDQDRLLFDYVNLEEEIDQKVTHLDELNTYIKSLGRVKSKRTAIRVNVAQPAIDPLKRSSPSRWLLPLGIAGALALSMLVGVGLELIDTSVRTSRDITQHVGLPLLGVVPHTDDEEVAIEQTETAVRDAPRSMVAESFRRMRTSLQFSSPGRRQRSLLITSPRPNDGKTTIACNLAIATAQGGRRVLLVDANLRRPEFHRLFAGVPQKGLSNLLIGEGTLSSYVVPTDVANLEVLGSGPPPHNPVELLGNERCKAILEEASTRYDLVLLDVAPVLLASEALVLAPVVDGVILVVRAKENSRGLARRARTVRSVVGANVFGAVLNAAQVTRGGYFREQFRAYYDYHADSEQAELQAQPPPSDPSPPKTRG